MSVLLVPSAVADAAVAAVADATGAPIGVAGGTGAPIGVVGGTRSVEVAVFDADTQPADGVLARVAFYVPPYLSGPAGLRPMTRMPRLRVCQTLTAGVDDVWPWLPPGVTLCNAAGVHDASTAELVVGLILAALRGIDDFARAMPQGRWAAGPRPALADRRVVVVGFGGVGRAVAARLTPFEVDVVPVARTPRPAADPPVHGVAELPDLLPTADVVVLVVPLDASTRGLADAAFLARMRDGALLVNAARGPVVVTSDLQRELASGRLRAALDVVDPEPLPPDHPLWRAPGLLVSPHVGGDTSAFPPRARRLIADQVRRWVTGAPLRNLVPRPDPAPA